MTHQVLSRKYRPQTFGALVGQDHVGRILKNALTTGRVGHAYLFVGPRGVGKTTAARIFARALNCAGREASAGEPCGDCPSCRDIAAGLDLDVVEMDAASNNHVEDVRRLREQVGYATVRSPYRIWIVDEVHMLSLPAFNAFLKTLEEPPERVKFVFCTTEEHKLPPTFRSRCQRIEFRAIEASGIAGRLRWLAEQEGVEVEEGLVGEIAALALGGLRDAESLLEQLLAACPGGPLREADLDALAGRAPSSLLGGLTRAVEAGDAAAALEAVDACLATGCKPGVLLDQWLEALRRDLVAAARGESPRSVARLARSLDVLLEKRMHMRAGAEGALLCQVAAVELARLPEARDLDALLEALRDQRASPPPGGAGAAPGGPGRASAPPPPTARPSPDDEEDVPAEARPPAPPPSPEALGARDVAERWPALVEAAKGSDPRLGVALGRARPGALEGSALEIRLPASDGLARSTLERRDAVLAFRRLTARLLGRELVPRPSMEGPPPARAAGTRPEEHPSVRLVTETTGGWLLHMEPSPSEGETGEHEE